MNKSFAEIFCSHHGLPPARYVPALFRRILYPHAVPLAPVLRLFSRTYFEPDFELIRNVSFATQWQELRDAISEFHSHPRSRDFLRSRLRLRVSTRRLEHVAHHLIGAGQPGDSIPPGDSTPPTKPARPATGE